MQARGFTFPAAFANADLNAMRVGIKLGILDPKFILGYTMHLAGEITPPVCSDMRVCSIFTPVSKITQNLCR